jgi:RNA polymerase sigma-70 factor, ECF subfamily
MEAPGAALDDEGGPGWAPSAEVSALPAADDARFRSCRDAHFEFVWRSVRRLGVPEADADDAVQQVFIVLAKRLGKVAPESERAFLFGTSIRVASHARRAARRRGEVPLGDAAAPGEAPEPTDEGPSTEDLAAQRRARALLDEALETLPMEARAVFVLFELEELTLAEIAALLEIPQGTAASRLRRGRELFQAGIARLSARRARRRA